MRKYRILAVLLLTSNAVFATNLAIKLDITENAKNLISQVISKATLPEKQQKDIVTNNHITIGFIDNLNSEEEAKKAQDIACNFLNDYIQNANLVFTVDEVNIKFGNYTTLTPDITTENSLKTLNKLLELHMNNKGYTFNKHTKNNKYVPHMTLVKSTVGPNRLNSMNNEINNLKKNRKNGELYFKLKKCSGSIW